MNCYGVFSTAKNEGLLIRRTNRGREMEGLFQETDDPRKYIGIGIWYEYF
jgi:hypothetical protein